MDIITEYMNNKVICLSLWSPLSSPKAFIHGVDKTGRPIIIYYSQFHFPANADLEKTKKFSLCILAETEKLYVRPLKFKKK